MYLQFSRSSLPPNTRLISPIRIIIYRTDTFVYFNTLKEDISCYYFAIFFLHFVILLQRIFHQRDPNKVAVFSSTETASKDRLYTYYILPYQPEAYEAVFLHCHGRLVAPQTGRMFCRTLQYLSHFVIKTLSYFVINLKWMVGGQVNPIVSIIIDNNN